MQTSDETRRWELLLRVDPDVTALTTLGRSTVYREIASGRLRAVRIGRAVRVRPEDLQAWLDQHADAGVNEQLDGADKLNGSLR